MPLMNLEEILDRVQELKQDNAEKDEVIRIQQAQINDLENKVQELMEQCREAEQKGAQLAEQTRQADELLNKLSEVLA